MDLINEAVLQHHGILGMHWGRKKGMNISGDSVNQRKMTDNEINTYAKNRIKKVGKKQAIEAEYDEYHRKIRNLNRADVAASLGLIGGVATVGVTGAFPVAIATGAAWVTHNIIATKRRLTTNNRANQNLKILGATPAISKGKKWIDSHQHDIAMQQHLEAARIHQMMVENDMQMVNQHNIEIQNQIFQQHTQAF